MSGSLSRRITLAAGPTPMRCAWSQSRLMRTAKFALASPAERVRQASTGRRRAWSVPASPVAKWAAVINSISARFGESIRFTNSSQNSGSTIGSPPPDSTAFHRPMLFIRRSTGSGSRATLSRVSRSRETGEA